MKKDYCLFIEPYTYIELQRNKILFYNTLNGTFLESDEKIIIELFKDIKKEKDFYLVNVSEKELNHNTIANFITKLRNLFICECLNIDFLEKKPIIIKSESKVNNSLSDIKGTQFSLSNIKNLNSYLREITIVTNTNNSNQVFDINKVYFQASSNLDIFNESGHLNNENIDLIISIIKSCPIDYINILGSKIFEFSNINKLFNFLNAVDVVKVIHLSYNDIIKLFNQKEVDTCKNFLKELDKNFSILNIIINSPFSSINFNIIKNLQENYKVSLEFQFLVEEDEDVNVAEIIINKYKIKNASLLPYYNGKNLNFFKENVFLTEDDIKDIPPQDSEALLIKSSINSNYFGKLIFMSNGDIYSNIHTSKVGNLADNKLHEVIYHEIDKGNWVYTRKKANPCSECIYNNFCPPINKYEFDLNRNNLCHLWNFN